MLDLLPVTMVITSSVDRESAGGVVSSIGDSSKPGKIAAAELGKVVPAGLRKIISSEYGKIV
jgi:hypothetical protein